MASKMHNKHTHTSVTMAVLGRESAYQKQKYVSPSGLQVVEFTAQNLLSSLLYEHGCKCLHIVKIVPLK